MPDATCLYNDMSPNEDERNDAKGATGILFLLPHIDLDDEVRSFCLDHYLLIVEYTDCVDILYWWVKKTD